MEQPDTASLAQDDSASSSRDSSEGDAAAVPFSLMDEELLHVFTFLSVEDRQRLRGVCTQWRTLIEHNFGIKVMIKNSTHSLVSSCSAAVEVDLNSMTIPFPDDNLIAFANRINKLSFSNIVVTYNLISFLKACSNNLSHLCFSYIVIDQPFTEWDSLHPQPNNLPISLPALRSLETKSLAFSDAVLELFNFLAEKVAYGALEEITIQAQNPAVIPLQLIFAHVVNETAHPLLRLIRKNRSSLQKFSMGRASLPTVIKFHPQTRRNESETSFVIPNEEWEPPQIHQLEIHPYFREEWAPMLRDQHRIEEMRMGSCNVSRWNDIHLAIRANATALKIFSVGGLSFGQIWDCAVFQNCVNLEELSIEISHTHKINFGMLPSNLKSLSVFGPIQRSEIEAIADMLISLKYLKFTHLGRISEFNEAIDDKVTLDVFKRLLRIPSLRLLSFTTCSAISIDWDMISSWCSKVNKEENGFVFYERFSQLHGEYMRNGITIELTDAFKRDEFEWDSPEWIEEFMAARSAEGNADEDGETSHDQHGSRRPSVISFAQPEVRQLDLDEEDDIV